MKKTGKSTNYGKNHFNLDVYNELKIKNLQQEKVELQEIIKEKGLDNIEGVMRMLDEKIRELKEKAGDGV